MKDKLIIVLLIIAAVTFTTAAFYLASVEEGIFIEVFGE